MKAYGSSLLKSCPKFAQCGKNYYALTEKLYLGESSYNSEISAFARTYRASFSMFLCSRQWNRLTEQNSESTAGQGLCRLACPEFLTPWHRFDTKKHPAPINSAGCFCFKSSPAVFRSWNFSFEQKSAFSNRILPNISENKRFLLDRVG